MMINVLLLIWNRTAEIMFEKYKVPALFLAKNAVSLSHCSASNFHWSSVICLLQILFRTLSTIIVVNSFFDFFVFALLGSHVLCFWSCYFFSCG